MKTNNVILVGYMGSGKSTLGIRLSYRLRQTFLDTDKMIEKQQKRTIKDIFAQDGEETFRMLETELLKQMLKTERHKIISTGGGMPLRPENRRLLKKMGKVFYLHITPETVYERLKGDAKRPLLQVEDPLTRIREMIRDRDAAYRDAAHVVIDVDHKTAEEIVKEIEGHCK